jgi:hypothetical protein
MISVRRLKGYDYELAMRVGCRPEHELMLYQCITCSTMTWVGYVEDIPACMWGLIPPTLLSDRAYLWLLVTELVRDHQFCFVRHSQLEMAKMLEKYPTIVGHCDRSHKDSMRWLRWLGAKFDETPGQYATFTIARKD